MAFVSQQNRQSDFLALPNSHAAPGSYNISANSSPKHLVAPFNSSTVRRAFDSANNPGPGDYDIPRRIIQANAKSYQNKGNFTIHIKQAGTHPFLSNQQRFARSKTEGPGPGSYSKAINQIRQPIKENVAHQKKQLFTDQIKRYPSIVSKTVFLNQKRIKSEPVKDDSFKIWKQFVQNKKGVVSGAWGKDKTRRFSKKSYTEMGPGKYQTDPKPRKQKGLRKGSVNFESKGVRTFFDTLVHGTLNKDRCHSLNRLGIFHEEVPSPGEYNIEQSAFEFDPGTVKYKNQSFGSVIDRFGTLTPKESTQVPFYVEKRRDPRQFLRKDVPFGSDAQRMVFADKKEAPGPGSYNYVSHSQKKILRLHNQNFGSFIERPINQSIRQNRLGPGYYTTQRAAVSEEPSRKSSVFASKTKRKQLGKGEDKMFGKYDIHGEDIGRRMFATLVHRQNLKKIDTKIPAFSKSSPRFSYHKKKAPVTKDKTENHLQLAMNAKRKQKQERMRQKVIEEGQEQAQAQRPPMGGGGERFAVQKRSPGVGDYSLRNNWMRKSYNIKYNPKK